MNMMELKPGLEIPSVSKHVTLERVRLFYGESEKNIHTDEAAAREVGLPCPIAPALMPTAFLSEMLAGFFGKSWIVGGAIALTFTGMVLVGDIITARGVVEESEADDSGTRVSLKIWCEKQTGSRVVVGRASAVLVSSP